MKVVLLAPTPPPIGGIAAWTKRMLEARLKNGWQVVVVDEKMIGGRAVFGDGSGRRFFTEMVRCLRIWRDLRRALKDPEVRIVHSCIPSRPLSMMREMVCARIAKAHGRKWIIHFRCTVPNTTRSAIGRMLLKRICTLSDLIIALNEQSEKFLKACTHTTIAMIPNFVEESQICEERCIADELRRIVYIGGVVAEKGCADIIETAKQFPGIEFRLVGTASVAMREAARGVENVALVRETDNVGVQKELEWADAFLFLSRYDGEGFSNALAEAMAAGLPCIVTDWAANADMIEHQGGVVVPIGSVEATVNAIRAIQPKHVREAQSQFNIRKMRECYSAHAVLNQYVDAYEALIENER